MTLYEIDSLESGECRAIGRDDIHVYCQHPFVETLMPTGRLGWTRPAGTATYCVVCPEAGPGIRQLAPPGAGCRDCG